MTSPSRRKFISTGLGAAAAGGIGYLTRDYWYPLVLERIAPKPTPSSSPIQTPANNPPVVDLKIVSPRFLNPYVGQKVKFGYVVSDEDGDQLALKLIEDDQTVKEWTVEKAPNSQITNVDDVISRSYQKEGGHKLVLEASDKDKKSKRWDDISFDVETEQIPDYPTKPLDVKYKGINYYATGISGWGFYTPTKDQMNEHFDTILNELGCNAIIVTGDGNAEDHLIESTRLALGKGFDSVYIHPRYVNESIDTALEKLAKFAPKVKSLREESSKVVFMIGREFSIEQSGIVRGSDWFTRLANIARDWNRIQSMFGPYTWKVISALNKSYGHELAYASGAWEADLVPWDNPAFESVMTNAYIDQYYGHTETNVLGQLSGLKRYGKPVHSTEWGCFAFPDGEKYGGGGSLFKPWQFPEDQKEQANYIIKYLNMLNRAKIDGSFYILYDDPFPQSTGLLNGTRRRLGFYAYKSYRRAGS